MYFLMSVAIVAMSVSMSSCKKDDTTVEADTTTLLQDDAQANNILDEVDNEADEVTADIKISGGKKSATEDSTTYSGREVTWTLNADGSKTGLIVFTNFSHPKAKNEKVKNGKIHIVVTGSRIENTFKRVVTFENFTINGNKIEGTKTIEKIEDLKYQIKMTDGKITFEDGSSITCNSTRIRTMVKGIATPLYIWDDAYTFEGSASGVNRNGKAYSKEITQPVKILTIFKFPVEGVFTLTVGDKQLVLDYGDGSLDNKATVTVDGVSKEITLRK